MYQVLARKYRPQGFEELIGQDHVSKTLTNAIGQKRIAHGYIFAGQRGTGKTSAARILARCLNCVDGPTAAPCGKCASCTEAAVGNSVDVIEIDAASNRGINEMRELRENIKYRPSRDQYKVFIIDEAHQITSEAFNALLKTLEEPPEWVVFVLCTTEAHKIPATIASRCQQFTFRSVGFTEVVARLLWICEQEGVETAEEVLTVLAQAGEGSVRDSLSALDQAIACYGNKLEAADVRRLLGMFSVESLHAVTETLAAGDSRRMLEIVAELERDGRSLHHFCRELARYFRNLLVTKVSGGTGNLVAASADEQKRLAEIAAEFSEEDLTRYLQLTLDLYRELQFSLQPRLHLELGLLRLVHAGRLLPIEEALAGISGSGGNSPDGGSRSASPSRSGSTSRNNPARSAPSQTAPVADTAEPVAPPPEVAPQLTGVKAKLYAALTERKMKVIADAVEMSVIEEADGELRFTAGREFTLALKSKELADVVREVAGAQWKAVYVPGESSEAESPAVSGDDENEARERALAHPEVQRYQKTFPRSQVRAVRNLKQ